MTPDILEAPPTQTVGHYTEATLDQPGWYFMYPKYPDAFGCPKFVEVAQDAIEDGWLKCRKYSGDYMGPIIPPAPPQ